MFSGNSERGNDSLRESGRLFVHLTKVASVEVVFEIISHCHPVEVARGICEAFLGSHVCHLFMGNGNNVASDVVSFAGGSIGDI